MEFHEKLQELRRQRGLTQEGLAQVLHVSRTAVSKWESGRGYPNIDSLKAAAGFFGVTVDALLSAEALPSPGPEDTPQKTLPSLDPGFGLSDCAACSLLFLPCFGERADGILRAVPLLSLTGISPYTHTAYLAAVIAVTVCGLLTLALQNCRHSRWLRAKHGLSLALSAVGTLLFIIGRQPYAAALLFLLLAAKVLLLTKKR